MKVLIASPGPLDVEVFATGGVGGEVCSKPHFYGSGKEGVAAVIRVMTEDGKLLKAARLVIDGSTGKMTLQDRSEPGKAAMERGPILPIGDQVVSVTLKK
jgi:hypothetical protein